MKNRIKVIPKVWYEKGRLLAWEHFIRHLEWGFVDSEGYPRKYFAGLYLCKSWNSDETRIKAEKVCKEGYDEGWQMLLEIYNLGKTHSERKASGNDNS
jgi:hypothetical protein